MNKKIFSILASFLLSVIIWGLVSLSNYYVTRIRVPLRLVNIPVGYVVGSASAREVTINLKGEGWRIVPILWGNTPSFIIPLNQGENTEEIVLKDVIRENEWLSNGIQVYDIYPGILKYKIEKMKQKKVKVYPNIKLSFNAGFVLSSNIKVVPESIIVYGPKNILSQIDSIPTVSKEFSNLESGVDERIDIQPMEDLKYDNNSLNIRFDIQKVADKNFENIEVVVNNLPKSREVSLFPNKISFVLRGGINILSKLKDDDFHPYVDYQALIMDTTGTIEPSINTPAFIKLIDIKPLRLKYIIKKY